MRKKKLRPPVKIHGGKFYLSNWIVDNLPKNYQEMTYLEPYCGAASVLFNKEKSHEEGINDIDQGMVHILSALRDESNEFIGRLKRTKYTENTFKRALKKVAKGLDDYLDHAVSEFIVRRMSRGGLKKAFAWSSRKRGGKPGDVNAWETIIKQLPLLAKKIQGVYIFNKPATQVIKAFNDKNTVVYCDPPYLDATRTSTNSYEFELSLDDHIELAAVLNGFKGKALISGYSSTIYRELYKGWTCKRKRIANHASQQKKKQIKTECLWINF